MPLISVIVPVYKAEKWLHRCVDSILAQTMTDFELLLIDDGSPDRSGEICDEYAAKDSRVRVFHKENGGVSSARQKGLENACGEYIIHCDPDDWVESDMLMELTQYAKETQADMVICDFYTEDMGGGNSNYVKQNMNNINSSEEVLNKLVNLQIHGSCWNKLIKRSCCNGISFTPENIVYAEDELFNIRLLNSTIKKVVYLSKAFYHYVKHDSSLTSFSDIKVILSRIKELEELEKILNAGHYDNFFVIKKEILFNLFMTNKLRNVYGLFANIYPKIIELGRNFNPRTPIQYFFAMALKGYPRLAYYLCNLNLFIIFNLRKLKNKII